MSDPGKTRVGDFRPLPPLPRTELVRGEEVAGYRIEEVIGRGGMGIVYRAEHKHLGRTVALKLMPPILAANADFRQRFITEARHAASVTHPNIVTVFDAGEADGRLYIAMEYVDGSDLRAVLAARGGPLHFGETAGIAVALGKALDAAHAAGLVHRDVKPGNVLLSDGHCSLTDFGLTTRALSPNKLTEEGSVVGTLDYAAPEQIKGEKVDGRADVYSLGCVLYQCLTGVVPFEAESNVGIMRAHVEQVAPPATGYRRDLPPAVDAVLVRALAKDPRERWPSASSFAAALRAALGLNRRASDKQEDAAPRVLVTVGDPAIHALLRVALARGEIEVVSTTGEGSVPMLALVGDDPIAAPAS